MSIVLSHHNIPIELLTNIVLSLLAQQPLGPPTQLIPLLLTSKSFYNVLSSNSCLANICRLKLDVQAIERRAFKPVDSQLASHLTKTFRMIKQLRRKLTARTFLPHYLPADVPIPCEDDELNDADILLELYVLRLDSDGKNYAQLEHAGVRDYVRDFVLNRLYDDAELNDGWPLENAQNSCALWLMWMFTLKDDLQKESPEERETIVRKILPYGTLTHRYPASEAPPNHFHLPLLPHLRSHQLPLVHTLPSSTSDPSLSPPPLKNRLVYPHYLDPSRALIVNHFDSDIPFAIPLASIAAKLLFVARRELFIIRAPPHVSQAPTNPNAPFAQPTVADYERLNNVKAARVPMWAKWDWEKGCVGRVNQPPMVVTPPPTTGASTAPTTAPVPVTLIPPPPPLDDNFEESKLWDTTWHRHRLCIDYAEPKPVFEPGKVYVPGTMDAQWEGKIWLPALVAFNQALQPQNAAYPGPPPLYNMPGMPPPPFSERTLMMTMQFSFLDVREHWRVCGCVEKGVRCNDACAEGDVEMQEDDDRKMVEKNVWTRVEKTTGVMGVVEEDDEDEEMEYEEDDEEYEDEDDAMSSGESDYTMSDARSSSSEGAEQQDDAPFAVQPSQILRLDEHAACGIIPVPLPVMYIPPPASSPPPPGPETQIDPAAPPIVPFHVATQLPPPNVQTLVPGQDGTSITDPQTGVVVPLPPGTNIDKVDFSMSNAWFPGRLGGVGIIRREGLSASTSNAPVEENDRPRDEVVVFVNYDIPSSEGVRNVDGSCDSFGGPQSAKMMGGKGRERKEGMWVYETFDKKRKSVHQHHALKRGEVELVEAYLEDEWAKDDERLRRGVQSVRRSREERYEAAMQRAFDSGVVCCEKCLEIARAKSFEKRKMEQKAKKALDRFLRDFGKEKVVGKEDDDEDEDEMLLDDLDIPSFGFDFGDDTQSTSSSSSSSTNTYTALKSTPFCAAPSTNTLHPPHPAAPLIFGDNVYLDRKSGNEGKYGVAPLPSFDRSKVGVDCDGVRDVILTGETTSDRRCWGRVGIYGRVRPWDGLVGILRVSQNNEERDTYMFVFGYVVGGENFVGEWRLAMTDPTAPAWSGAFVMSRKERD